MLDASLPWRIDIVCECSIIGISDMISKAFVVGYGIGIRVSVLLVAGCFHVLCYLQYYCIPVEGRVFLGRKYAMRDVVWGMKNYTLNQTRDTNPID